MTKKELSQLYYLRREVEQITWEIAELEALATGGSARITGLPHGESADKISRYGAEIADLQTLKDLKVQECWIELNRLNRYIDAIPDSMTRQVFRLRYANGFSWRQVANKVGGGNTEDSVRKRHDRFLQNQ